MTSNKYLHFCQLFGDGHGHAMWPTNLAQRFVEEDLEVGATMTLAAVGSYATSTTLLVAAPAFSGLGVSVRLIRRTRVRTICVLSAEEPALLAIAETWAATRQAVLVTQLANLPTEYGYSYVSIGCRIFVLLFWEL